MFEILKYNQIKNIIKKIRDFVLDANVYTAQ